MLRWFFPACLLLVTACQSLSLRPAHWVVGSSPLDYAVFYYGRSATNATDDASMLVLELQGSGYLTYRSGSSPRVGDAFWLERENARWDEYQTDQIVVPSELAQACFQRLVDYGLYEEESGWFGKKKEEDPAGDGIMVLSNIGGRKQARYTTDPRVRQLVRVLLQQF